MGFYDIEWTDCYQFSMLQTYRSQQVINRFFYRTLDTYTGSLEAAAGGFYSWWSTHLTPFQSQELSYDSVILRELFGTKQTFEYEVVGGNGSQAGAELPAFFGARFSLSPADTRVKKGRKIFSGMLEEMVDIDTVAAGYADEVADIEAALNDGFSAGGSTFMPVLLSPANDRHTGNLIVAVLTATFRGWSTQGSRKIGRGS